MGAGLSSRLDLRTDRFVADRDPPQLWQVKVQVLPEHLTKIIYSARSDRS
jgi:hypothetical protein